MTHRGINIPKPIQVRAAEDGLPLWVRRNGRWQRVAAVQNVWRIDEGWWEEPISRLYFQVLTESGAVLTLFRDLIKGAWYEQRP